MDELIYWHTANKLLELALLASNPTSLENYLEYRYE